MSRVFSLTGAVFAFHCLSLTERQEVTSLLQSNNGELYDAKNTRKPDVVYVLTSFWVDCKPAAAFANVSVRLVTRFWLQEMLRIGRWLCPHSNTFFEPPSRPNDLWLQYPVEYQDAGQINDCKADRDVDRMQDDLRPRRSTSCRVRLPCSPGYLFRGAVPLWPYIAAFLATPIRDVHELEARLQLITLSRPRRRFNCLEYAVNEVHDVLFDDLLTTEEQAKFFKDVLPEMTRMVLALPQMFAAPPPLLTTQEVGGRVNACSNNNKDEDGKSRVDISNEAQLMTQSHRFSKLEVLTLVCGCFFGIFPEQDVAKSELGQRSRKTGRLGIDIGNDIIQFPHFTAVRMFSAPDNMGKMVMLKSQKICCLLQYFLRVIPLAVSKRDALSAEVIDFTRVSVHLPLAQGQIGAEHSSENLVKILANSSPANCISQARSGADTPPQLYAARCVSDVRIEDLNRHLQIDFANKFAGGGVLSSGCVQEEIRFLVSPELLVSCLVFAKLEPHEAFVVHGTERYSAYQGYGGSFVYGGNFEDTTPLDSLPDGCMRRECVIVGIDATDYGSVRVQRQYTRGHVWRDLVKAYAGFAYPKVSDDVSCWPVASGNWGCGVFHGDRELKFLIQWLAASLCHRELVYVFFERDSDLQTKVETLLTLATSLKSREWDQQKSGLIQWLMEFLLNEVGVDCGTRVGEHSVLTRASLSLKRALVALDGRQEVTGSKPQQLQCEHIALSQTDLLSRDSNVEDSRTTSTQQEEHLDETMKKKAKILSKELHQRTMQEFYTPKQ